MARRGFYVLVALSVIRCAWMAMNGNKDVDREKSTAEFLQSRKQLIPRQFTAVSPLPPVHVALAMCGDRTDLTVIKSVLMFTPGPLHFHIVTEEKNTPRLHQQLDEWRPYIQEGFSVDFVDPKKLFPDDSWSRFHKPCACGRLFMHRVLPESVDWLIYLDSDTVVIRSLRLLWDVQQEMNASQVMAATLNDFVLNEYKKKVAVPLVPPAGMNSGVLLLHLRALRAVDWLDMLTLYRKEYKKEIRLGDQCLLNALFHFHPDMLHVFDPNWNFGYNFCNQCSRMDLSQCDALKKSGVNLVHGYSKAFYRERAYAKHIRMMHQIIAEHTHLQYRFNATIVPPALYDFKTNTQCEEILFHNLKPLQLYRYDV